MPSGNEYTHVAFADETHHNIGRFRGVAIVSAKVELARQFHNELTFLLRESNVSEFKWNECGSAQMKFAGFKMIDFAIRQTCRNCLRIDILTWDIEDDRHKIKARDDRKNLQYMYRQLFKNVLRERWPSENTWRLCPDENTAMDWAWIWGYLDRHSQTEQVIHDLFTFPEIEVIFREEFNVHSITPSKSENMPLIQLADLFAGMGVYSRTYYDRFDCWSREHSPQQDIFESEKDSSDLSKTDKARCPLLNELYEKCRNKRMGVSLKTDKGLRTRDPKNPINFWWYIPQRDDDRAPVKDFSK